METHARLLQRYQTDGEPVRYGGTGGALSAPQRLLLLYKLVDCDDVDRTDNSDRRTTHTTFRKTDELESCTSIYGRPESL